VVLAAGKKKTKAGVEHHRDGESKPTLPPKFGLKWLENGGELTGLKMEELVRGGHGVLFGSRIPKHYFMVKGFGETDQGDGSDPWETGSYDLALEDAGTLPHFLTCFAFDVLQPNSDHTRGLYLLECAFFQLFEAFCDLWTHWLNSFSYSS